MDFEQLTTFLEVAKQGNFSRAGEVVFRSQPAVSAQIRQLEIEYGEKLFDRAGKTIRLTPAGEILAGYAAHMLQLRAESLHAVTGQRDTIEGVLSIGANEATFLYVLPDLFAQYHRLHPQVQISVYRSFSHKVIQKVEDGVIDMGVVTLPVKVPSLKVIKIFRDQMMLAVHPDNPLAAFASVNMNQVAEQALILPKTGSMRTLIEKQLRPFGRKVRITMELTSVVMIKKFVAAGFGVSLISASFAGDEVREGKIKLIALDGVELWRELGLVYRRDRSLPASAVALIEIVRASRRQRDAQKPPRNPEP